MRNILFSLVALACLVVACRTSDTSLPDLEGPEKHDLPAFLASSTSTQAEMILPNGTGGAGDSTTQTSSSAVSSSNAASASDASSVSTGQSTSAGSGGSGGAPASPGNPEYVTDLLLYAGCEVDGTDVPVADGHTSPSECEHSVITPAHNDDGDFYEVWGYFNWTSSDPRITVECFNGEHDNFCWPVGHADVFDTSDLSEPTATITACAVNDCPMPRPDDCQDQLCVSFTSESVVNIEGEWSPTGATFDDRDVLTLSQDGRTFLDPLFGVQHGNILSTSVSFDVDDYSYIGNFTDRDHLVGQVSDSIGGNYIGDWSAERTTL
ncbi:MAG: hypothetical protein WA001_05965 [Patescibacteria group bacterium]